MMSEVRNTRDGDLLILTLDRASKKNALTGAMYDALTAALDEAAADTSIGAIVIEGSGGCFTAGNDIADFLEHAGAFDSSPALTFIRRIASCDTPIVAAVDGVAVGVGTTMLLHCDLVYATSRAQFRMPFVDLGLVPEAGASLLVPARIGFVRATELLLLGDGFDAETARTLGLINEVVAVDELRERALAQARRLAAKPRNALRAARRLMRGDRAAVLARIEDEAKAFAAALAGSEARGAFQAFMARSRK
jgi:enoyl-CoA hydratase/carnithine racemase